MFMELDELREAVAKLTFVFAKTMPQFPHWYVKRTPENEETYVALFQAIQHHEQGYVQKFRGVQRRYLELGDGYKYWAMTTRIPAAIDINRDKQLRDQDGTAAC